VFRHSLSGRVEDPRRGGRKLQRGENPGEHRPLVRGNLSQRERTRGGRKASKQVKQAERGGSVVKDPGRPGSLHSRLRKGDP